MLPLMAATSFEHRGPQCLIRGDLSHPAGDLVRLNPDICRLWRDLQTCSKISRLASVNCFLLFPQCSLRDLRCSISVFRDLVIPKCRLRDLLAALSVFWYLLSTQKQKSRSQISWNPLPRFLWDLLFTCSFLQLWTGPNSVHPRLTREYFPKISNHK